MVFNSYYYSCIYNKTYIFPLIQNVRTKNTFLDIYYLYFDYFDGVYAITVCVWYVVFTYFDDHINENEDYSTTITTIK